MKSEDPIATTIESMVDAGALAGAATLIWRDGKVVQIATVGCRDVEARQRERDQRLAYVIRCKIELGYNRARIFYIYSMIDLFSTGENLRNTFPHLGGIGLPETAHR